MSRIPVYVSLQQFCEKDPGPLRALEAAGFEVRRNTLGRRLKRDELPAALGDAQAVIAGVEPFDAQVLAALPSLRCISRCGVGTDSIDLAAAKARGIAVLVTRDEVVAPVAEMTVGMMLALARNFPLHAADFRDGRWVKRTGSMLRDWTVGLVGYGRIGRAVEQLLAPFGPRVLASDPFVPGTLALPDLLPRCDLVSLHAADARSEGPALIGAPELALMKKGAFLVNTARGRLVDEAALHAALVSGRLAGAALDVFGEEPYAGPLAKLPQVLATPHVATLTESSRLAMELSAARQVVEFFKGKAPA